jgi:hypothetical protein
MFGKLLRMMKPWKKGDPNFIGEHLGTTILGNTHVVDFIAVPLFGGSSSSERVAAIMAGAYQIARHNVLLDHVEFSRLLYLRALASTIWGVIGQRKYPLIARSRIDTTLLNDAVLAMLGKKCEVSAEDWFMSQAIHQEEFFDKLAVEAGLRGSFSGNLNVLAFSEIYGQFIHRMLGLSSEPLPVADRRRLTLAICHAIASVNNIF